MRTFEDWTISWINEDIISSLGEILQSTHHKANQKRFSYYIIQLEIFQVERVHGFLLE